MKIVGGIVAFVVVAASAGACGNAYDEANGADSGASVPDSATADAASDAASDAVVDAASVTPPRRPSPCPLVECPASFELCDDETCTDPLDGDYSRTGSTTVENGTCLAAASGGGDSSFHRNRPLDATRSAHVTLAFRIFALDTTDRVIASIASQGETWQIRARGSMLELCELNGDGLRCTPPIAFTLSGTVHLYGVAAPAGSPKTSFALSVEQTCSPDRVLDVTAPFTGADLRATVGCLAGTAACSMRFDDAVFVSDPE